ncbi:MAG TPA: extensin family protein [Arachnia sp.]|nr:extensin family protein [Arachnia sp.]
MIHRRAFLLGAAVLPLAGCGLLDRFTPGVDGPVDDSGQPECWTPEELVSFDAIDGAPLSYEISGKKQPFQADPRFVEKLDDWADDWAGLSGLGKITGISTYGAYVDKCPSMHAAGRAFDFGVVTHKKGKVSCRGDLWGDDGKRLRSYWRLAASLSAHFTYTLTLAYNDLHLNHIHVDDAVSEDEKPTFDKDSRAQCLVVQNVATHVFGKKCPNTAAYDAATKDAVRSIQHDLGIKAPLADPDGWRAFLRGAASA